MELQIHSVQNRIRWWTIRSSFQICDFYECGLGAGAASPALSSQPAWQQNFYKRRKSDWNTLLFITHHQARARAIHIQCQVSSSDSEAFPGPVLWPLTLTDHQWLLTFGWLEIIRHRGPDQVCSPQPAVWPPHTAVKLAGNHWEMKSKPLLPKSYYSMNVCFQSFRRGSIPHARIWASCQQSEAIFGMTSDIYMGSVFSLQDSVVRTLKFYVDLICRFTRYNLKISSNPLLIISDHLWTSNVHGDSVLSSYLCGECGLYLECGAGSKVSGESLHTLQAAQADLGWWWKHPGQNLNLEMPGWRRVNTSSIKLIVLKNSDQIV